jgi:PAS domain S-box-containing protein
VTARRKGAAPSREPELDGLLREAVTEATRLLGASGGIIYLVDPEEGDLRFAFDSGITDGRRRSWVRGLRMPIGSGLFGKAVAERRVQVTADYLADDSFPHTALADRVVREVGMRSMVTAPVIDGGEVLGALGTYCERPDAFGEREIALVRTLADHAAVAIANRRLIDRLGRSERESEQRAALERRLRAIGGELTELREPGALLRRLLEAAISLTGADAGRIDLTPEDELGLRRRFGDIVAGILPLPEAPTGVDADSSGIAGLAIRTGHPVVTGDYLADPRFPRLPSQSAYVEAQGIRSAAAAPIARAGRVLGAVTVLSRRADAFGELAGLALAELSSEAAISILNAGLIEELAASREAVARNADREHALREIAADLTAIERPDDLLQRVVDEARRLLAGKHAQLDLVDPANGRLKLDTLAGWTDPDTELWRDPYLPVEGGGLTSLAVEAGHAMWTDDYLADTRFLHHEDGDEYMRKHGIRSMIAAPLHAEGELVGVLKVNSERLAAYGPAEADVLQHLADQAAVAITSTRLLDRLRSSEAHHRYLVDNSPDLVWAIDDEARFTFLSDTCERLTGWPADELLGRHFGALVHPSSGDVATRDWTVGQRDGSQELRARFNLLHRDGHPIPAEFIAHSTMVDGRFAGANGSVRDMTERERLEASLRLQAAQLASSEERAHLARELHDSVTQALFSMTLVTRTIEMLLDRDPAAARERLGALTELQRDALAEMRSLVFELRPGSLEESGLVQALRTHAAAVEGRVGIPIEFRAGAFDRAPVAVEDALYRIAQEALHNVVKHARATGVRLSVDPVEAGLRLTVEDDGVGFDAAATDLASRVGLAGMRSRAEGVGGTFQIRSRRGRGTRIDVVVPTPVST